MEDDLKFFSTEVDAWIEENCPESMRSPMPVSEQYGPLRVLTFLLMIPKSGSIQW